MFMVLDTLLILLFCIVLILLGYGLGTQKRWG
jgi:hypothetical protein